MVIGVVGTIADHVASCRYRITIPSQHSRHEWVEGPGDITIVSKFGTTPDSFRFSGTTYIYDVCDDHFVTPRRTHLLKMIDAADYITCTNDVLQDKILNETGRMATIITDPVQYPQQPVQMSEPKRILWFGHATNLRSLEEILDRLQEQYEVSVISNALKYTPWSHETMRERLDWCDAVIIPVGSAGASAEAKSPNRMTESINAGRFVVANPIPAYEGYDMYLGDIFEGLEWLTNNQQEAKQKLTLAQEKVRNLHAPEVVAAQWDALFDSILLAEKNTGKATSMSTFRTTTAR